MNLTGYTRIPMNSVSSDECKKLRTASHNTLSDEANAIFGGRPVQIRLLGGPSTHEPNSTLLPSTSVVETLDGSVEETFTFETFASLAAMAYSKRKDLILARVTTVDSNEDGKLYYSCYAAHQINKVLFRTQPEEGLLHRMKAKNPLNNVLIVGDVHYYKVTPEQMDLAQSRAVSRVPSSVDLAEVRETASLTDPSTLVFDAEFFATDDDYLMKANVREFFKTQSLGENDHILFTLYAADEHVVALPEPQLREIDRSWRNCFGVFGTKRYVKWFLLLYLIVGLLLVKFVVPPEYAYLVGFLLVFFLAFIIVFIIEFEV